MLPSSLSLRMRSSSAHNFFLTYPNLYAILKLSGGLFQIILHNLLDLLRLSFAIMHNAISKRILGKLTR